MAVIAGKVIRQTVKGKIIRTINGGKYVYKELCVICDSVGWIYATAWIDYEDMFCIPEKLSEKVVIRDEWDTLSIVDSYGSTHKIPAHFLYTKD